MGGLTNAITGMIDGRPQASPGAPVVLAARRDELRQLGA